MGIIKLCSLPVGLSEVSGEPYNTLQQISTLCSLIMKALSDLLACVVPDGDSLSDCCPCTTSVPLTDRGFTKCEGVVAGDRFAGSLSDWIYNTAGILVQESDQLLCHGRQSGRIESCTLYRKRHCFFEHIDWKSWLAYSTHTQMEYCQLPNHKWRVYGNSGKGFDHKVTSVITKCRKCTLQRISFL